MKKNATKKKSDESPTTKRYTDEEKASILGWIEKHNEEHGKGGQSAAVKQFGVSPMTLQLWMKRFKPNAGEAPEPKQSPSPEVEFTLPPEMDERLKAAPGKHYTAEERDVVLRFVEMYDGTHGGRGGAQAASKRWGMHMTSIGAWRRAARGNAPRTKAAGGVQQLLQQAMDITTLIDDTRLKLRDLEATRARLLARAAKA
jgi:transposase-like protein